MDETTTPDLEAHEAIEAILDIGDGTLRGYLEGHNPRTHGDADWRIAWPADIATLMEEGMPPVEMLVEDWLVPGELAWIYAEAEAWKTWVALHLALEVVRGGGRVVWFDEELGAAEISKRLVCLGADPNEVRDRFLYFPFPAWDMSSEHREGHEALLRAVKDLRMVVYDTATDMLAEADLDENSGKEVTQWVKEFLEPARRLGVAQVVLDHTPKGGSTAVGSRSKRAKAKIQWFLSVPKGGRGDSETAGKVKVTLTKNTVGAPLPAERTFEIGGGKNEPGAFAFRETSRGRTGAADEGPPLKDRIVDALRQHGPLTASKVREVVGGRNQAVVDTLRELARTPTATGVSVEAGSRGSLVYSYAATVFTPDDDT